MLDLDKFNEIRVHVAVVEKMNDLQDSFDVVAVVGQNQHVQPFVGHDDAALRHKEFDRFDQVLDGHELHGNYIGGNPRNFGRFAGGFRSGILSRVFDEIDSGPRRGVDRDNLVDAVLLDQRDVFCFEYQDEKRPHLLFGHRFGAVNGNGSLHIRIDYQGSQAEKFGNLPDKGDQIRIVEDQTELSV